MSNDKKSVHARSSSFSSLSFSLFCVSLSLSLYNFSTARKTMSVLPYVFYVAGEIEREKEKQGQSTYLGTIDLECASW